MARKTREITIHSDDRDNGKQFSLSEAPAGQAERWATRCIMAMIRGGVQIPENIRSMGVIGLMSRTIEAIGSMAYEDAAPLLAELMGCVKFRCDERTVRPLVESDIEEIKTFFLLRKEVVDLHTDFFSIVKKAAQELGSTENAS